MRAGAQGLADIFACAAIDFEIGKRRGKAQWQQRRQQKKRENLATDTAFECRRHSQQSHCRLPDPVPLDVSIPTFRRFQVSPPERADKPGQ